MGQRVIEVLDDGVGLSHRERVDGLFRFHGKLDGLDRVAIDQAVLRNCHGLHGAIAISAEITACSG